MFLKKVIRTTTLEVDANIDELIKGLMEIQGRCECEFLLTVFYRHKHHVSIRPNFYCLKNGSFTYSKTPYKPNKKPLLTGFPFFIRGRLYDNGLNKTKIIVEYIRNNELFLFYILLAVCNTAFFNLLAAWLFGTFYLETFLVSMLQFFALLFVFFSIYHDDQKFSGSNLANMQEDFFKKIKKITEVKK